MWKSDREKQQGRAVAAVFSKTNRILAGDPLVQVHTQPTPQHIASGLDQYPGWTEYPNIYLNLDKFGALNNPQTLVQLLGLNYHELAHVLFTPRKFKELVLPYHLGKAFNVLEDQRIESFFTATYEPAGKFFTETVIRFIVSNQKAWGSAFLWTHGRSYLPLEIRDEFEARFALPHRVAKAKEIIERYKTFTATNFENNKKAVQNVIREFNDLLRELDQNGEDQPENHCASTEQNLGDVDREQEQEAAKEDRKKRNREKRTGEDQSNFWDEDEDEEDSEDGTDEGDEGDREDHVEDDDGEGGSAAGTDDEEDDDDSDDAGSGEAGDDQDGDEDSDSEERSDGSGAGDSDEDDFDPDVDGDSDGSASGDGEDSDNDEFEEGEGGEDGEGGGGAGTTATEPEFTDRELKEYLGDITDAVIGDDSVEQELDRIYTAINDNGNVDFIDFNGHNHELVQGTLSDQNTINGITDNLRRLFAEVEPGWRYGSDVGKLNVGRAMLDPEDTDNHFDEWEEGREHDTGLEVVFSVDLSGSMGGSRGSAMWYASKALWMLKRAFEEVDAKVTVLGFHGATVGLYDRDMKMPRNEWPLWKDLGGNTLPAGSFQIARQILSATDMPNKLFVVITDGGWGSSEYTYLSGQYQMVSHDLGELLAAIPGTRMYVGVGNAGMANAQYEHLFNTRVNLSTTDALVRLVSTTVDAMMKERLF